jgi:hypothetical protein
MDALDFRVSSDRQTAQNQFEDLLQVVAEKDGSGRDWDRIRQALAECTYEEQLSGSDGASRTLYRLACRSCRRTRRAMRMRGGRKIREAAPDRGRYSSE